MRAVTPQELVRGECSGGRTVPGLVPRRLTESRPNPPPQNPGTGNLSGVTGNQPPRLTPGASDYRVGPSPVRLRQSAKEGKRDAFVYGSGCRRTRWGFFSPPQHPPEELGAGLGGSSGAGPTPGWEHKRWARAMNSTSPCTTLPQRPRNRRPGHSGSPKWQGAPGSREQSAIMGPQTPRKPSPNSSRCRTTASYWCSACRRGNPLSGYPPAKE
jgi:hypothetical protein